MCAKHSLLVGVGVHCASRQWSLGPQNLTNSITEWFCVVFFILEGQRTCTKKAQLAKESLRGGWQATVTWLCCFSQKTADKETTGCPGTAPLQPLLPQHLTEQKQSHESLGNQRGKEGARRFQFVFASVSTLGLCVVRLLIRAHWGACLPPQEKYLAGTSE